MVKTRSDLKGIRMSSKAPRKMPNASVSSPKGRSTKKYKGSNSYCPREVPSWQKEITNFFSPEQHNSSNDQLPCSSRETYFEKEQQ